MNHFSCKYHDPKNFTATPIAPDLEEAILGTIETVSDFLIDILSTSDLPMQKFKTSSQVTELEYNSQLSEQVYGVPDDATEGKYALVIWNDQRHSYADVINLIKNHLNKNEDFGDMIARTVDAYGRGILKISDNLDNLFLIKGRMERSGLIHTIRSTKDYFREEMCDCIIHWLGDIATSAINNDYLILGELVSKALCNKWQVGVRGSMSAHNQNLNTMNKVSSSLIGASIPNPGTLPLQFFTVEQPHSPSPTRVANPPPPSFWMNDGEPTPDPNDNGVTSRIQYLIYFDVRLWTSLRTTLRDLFISALVSNATHKPFLAECYAQVYPSVAEQSIFIDRESECSIVPHLATQLFTTPSIATTLLSKDYFSKYLAAMYTFFTQCRIGGRECVDIDATIAEDSFALRNRRFSQLFTDMDHLLNRNTDKSSVTGNPNRIKQVCSFLRLFQGVMPMIRQIDTHVEYESDMWIRYFNCMPSILELGSAISVGAYDCSSIQVADTVTIISNAIFNWAFGNSGLHGEIAQHNPSMRSVALKIGDLQQLSLMVPALKVEEGKVSLHHPLNAFLSGVIQYGKLNNREELRSLLLQGRNEITSSQQYEPDLMLQMLFDHNLRVLVLLSQIKVGLWVRNGLSTRNQMIYYREVTLRDIAFARDIFLAQTAVTVLDPETCIIRLLERWGLSKWPNLDVFDEHQSLYMLEDFIHYLIIFLMERRELMGLSEKEVKRKYITREIIQSLGFKGLSFSEICERVSDSLPGEELFEIVLNQLTTFKPPVGVTDSGIYELKAEFMPQFDPWYYFFSSAQVEEAESVLKTFFHKKNKQPLEDVVLEPIFEPITSGPFTSLGAFTRTPAFAFFVYKVLNFVMADTEKEREGDVLLGLILRLCHIAALDDLNMPLSGSPTFASAMCTDVHVEKPGFISSLSGRLPDRSKSSPLLLLYKISNLPAFQKSKAHALRVLGLIHSKDPEFVSKHVSDRIGDIQLVPAQQVGVSKEIQKSNELKKLAKKKQKRVLANMQKQQKKFAEMNKANIQEQHDEDSEAAENAKDESSFPCGQCILCRMPCDSKSVFGILANTQLSNTSRLVPLNDPDWVFEAFSSTQNLDEQEPDEEPLVGSPAWNAYRKDYLDNNKLGPGFPSEYSGSRTVVSSCCHTMHYACYTNYMETLTSRAHQLTRNLPDDAHKCECLCPLCRSMNNTFIPILWKNNTRSIVETLNETESFENFISVALSPLPFTEANRPMFTKNLLQSALELVDTEYVSLLGFDESEMPRHLAEQKALSELETALTSVAHNMSNGGTATNTKSTAFTLSSVCESVSDSISDLELSLRGVGYNNPMGGIILDQIPTLSLQLMRVLVEYARTTVAYCYGGHYSDEPRELGSMKEIPVRFTSQNFTSLLEAALFYSPGYRYSLVHFLRTYLYAEIMDTLNTLVREMSANADWTQNPVLLELPVQNVDPDTILALERIMSHLCSALKLDIDTSKWSRSQHGPVFYTMILKSITPFLRKGAILMYALCAKDYDPYDYMGYEDASEADKLCDLLKIPHFNALLHEMSKELEPQHAFTAIFSTWLMDRASTTEWNISYPGIVKLIRLPSRLDEFFSLPALRNKTDNSIYAEPAVCLFCSDISQVQQMSTFTHAGECNSHMTDCGHTIGIFLLPKRGTILFLKKPDHGSFMPAPYLDLHGENDDSRRGGRPQYLNKQRYNHLMRTYWLRHGLADFIARKLHSTIDIGGWDTM